MTRDQFKTMYRMARASLGDLWGDPDFLFNLLDSDKLEGYIYKLTGMGLHQPQNVRDLVMDGIIDRAHDMLKRA